MQPHIGYTHPYDKLFSWKFQPPDGESGFKTKRREGREGLIHSKNTQNLAFLKPTVRIEQNTILKVDSEGQKSKIEVFKNFQGSNFHKKSILNRLKPEFWIEI